METCQVLTKQKEENVASSLRVPNSPNKKVSPNIISIGKDNVNRVYCTFSTCSSNTLKIIAMLLKNNFEDNQNLVGSSDPSRRCNKPSDDVVGSKTTLLPKDTMTDIRDGINSLSGY